MDIIVLKQGATEEDIRHIAKKLEGRGLGVNVSQGTERTIIGEVHWNPVEAVSDGDQSLKPDQFDALMKELRPVAAAFGREI